MTMLSGRQLDWERQRLWREDCDRRFAARVEEQRWLHELEPERYSLLVPVDDEEWGDRGVHGRVERRGAEPEPGFVYWDADESPDSASAEDADLDAATGEYLIVRSDIDLGTRCTRTTRQTTTGAQSGACSPSCPRTATGGLSWSQAA